LPTFCPHCSAPVSICTAASIIRVREHAPACGRQESAQGPRPRRAAFRGRASHMIWAVLDRGGLAYRSSTLRYLRRVGSLTFSLRAIEAMDSPFLRRERIDCIWGMLIIAFPDLSRMELEAHQAKAHGWSACLSA